MQGSILGLHASPKGGVPKAPVIHLDVTKDGCVGDRQNDLKHHGGPKRAVCLMSVDLMEALQAAGHPIQGGTTGENLLISGVPWDVYSVGTVIRTEEVVLKITGDAPPCKTIKQSFLDDAFTLLSHKKVSQKTRWYAEVIQEGTLHQGEAVFVEPVN
jgi:MOSC domain-containing protein YiiM